ncbi:MAG: phosphate propanoyltransferase [Bacilli bacterium]
MKIQTGISARHVHLKKEDLIILFGDNNLTEYKKLSQTGEFSCEEMVTIKGSKGTIENVRVIGPLRNYTQVEISRTDSYILGIEPPVRNSGDLKGSETVTIIGPNGNTEAIESCIIAARHIHVNKENLDKYNLKDNEVVKIRVPGIKGGVLDNVVIKSADNYKLELHIDLDDANAHLIKQGDYLEMERNPNE